jgi:hypothetical protein
MENVGILVNDLAPARPPRRCSDAPAGMPYGLPPSFSTSRIASSHDERITDVEASRIEAHVGTHDPRQKDVADPLVDRVVPVDQLLMNEAALEPQLRGNRGHLARVMSRRPEAGDVDRTLPDLRFATDVPSKKRSNISICPTSLEG